MRFLPVQWVDVSTFLESRVQPVTLLRREAPRTFNTAFVPVSGLLGEEKIQWAITTAGEAVRVPLFSYKTLHPALPDLFGLGVQLGITAALDLQDVAQGKITAVQLIIGHQCTDMRPREEAFRCYIGIAFGV